MLKNIYYRGEDLKYVICESFFIRLFGISKNRRIFADIFFIVLDIRLTKIVWSTAVLHFLCPCVFKGNAVKSPKIFKPKACVFQNRIILLHPV